MEKISEGRKNLVITYTVLNPKGMAGLCKLLVQLCEELNGCAANESYLAASMLTRSIMDHIPPIFGYNTFAETASNYSGGKSFKQQMEHLNSSRHVADKHLHMTIRKKRGFTNIRPSRF